MLISVHIQKTAGRAFSEYLTRAFPGGVFFDYGLSAPETSREILEAIDRWRYNLSAQLFRDHCAEHAIEVIHGHLFPRFYHGIMPGADFVCWLREPVARVISEFNHMRRIEHKGDEAYEKAFRREITLAEYAEYDKQRDFQTKQLEGVDLEDFAFMGIVEDFAGSLARFDRRFGLSGLERPGWLNVNHHAVEPGPELCDHIRGLNRLDVELYRSAVALVGGLPAAAVARPALPEGFDPAAYLTLNPDVAEARQDPVTHYLNHGHREGRRWSAA